MSTAVFFFDSRKITLDCFDRRPIQNRPVVETKTTRRSVARTRHAHVHDVSYYYCCRTAAVRQGCTRSVVLFSCCLAPLICGVSKNDTQHDPSVECVKILSLDVNVRMGWYINYHKKFSYITAQIGAIYGHAWELRTKRQHSMKYGVWWSDKWHAPIKESAFSTAATRA